MAARSDRIRWGVIEDARGRQRRQRGVAALATAVVAGTVAIVLASVGEGGSHPASTSVAGPPQSQRAVLASCAIRKTKVLQGTPSHSLLSILGVLRRAETPADALPASTKAAVMRLSRSGFQVYVNYVRRARVIGSTPYYVWPVLYTGCRQVPVRHYETMMMDDGGGGVAGAGDATTIEQGHAVGGSGTANRSTLEMLVPDGVATVTLHYPAVTIGGSGLRGAPALTTRTKVVGNFVVIDVPRGPQRLFRPVTMTWYAANGHVVKTFTGL
jgi:hypothetical protein